MLTFKRKLILTKAQEQRIDKWIGTCRFVYNMCLEIRQSAWRNKQESVHKYDLSKQLTEIREIDWIEDVPRVALEMTIERVDRAYKSFFRGSRFPKFASKRKYKSISFTYFLHADTGKIKIPKMGWLKIFKDSPVTGKIKTITIKKEVTGYFALINTDAVKSIQNQDENQVLGIDMGLAHFVVDSKGRFTANPRHFKKHERQLRIENRSLARKKKGGKNWLKQAHRIGRLHNRIADVRRDFLHKLSTGIAKENHYAVIEDLNVAAMRRGNLGKGISDVGWGTFRTMLEYKTEVIAVNAKYTSQICSECGAKDSKNRISQSEFVCLSCGSQMNADENAALNILSRGTAILRERKESSLCVGEVDQIDHVGTITGAL